jgi:hypothetical protein
VTYTIKTCGAQIYLSVEARVSKWEDKESVMMGESWRLIGENGSQSKHIHFLATNIEKAVLSFL